MHLIISEKLDISTNEVLKWLTFYKQKVLIIDKNKEVEVNFSDGFDKPTFTYNAVRFSMDDIESIWFRRGRIKIVYDFDLNVEKNLLQYHINTKQTIEIFVNYLLINNRRHLGNPFRTDVNKLEVLYVAKECGLTIPETMLSDNSNQVLAGLGKDNIVTKLLVPLPFEHLEHEKRLNYLTFGYDFEANKDKEFTLSLFQKKIEKRFEIRTFFINDEMFSKAIFSQNDDMTTVDYRNYNHETPNRTEPFILPKNIQNRIKKLMKRLSLDCGSLDFIVDTHDNFIFLEVNPVGQFSDMSYNCNYELEKKIALFLKN
ncbi:ATP-GRASP peptide maturase, grasp-with-spasm system [Kordia sp. SMS9]|uniref:grasp-with-spasm system ATP-grasp peptide maturase n=1 Tax=Kordia sp. SMS9 TaxID=2282170 RepID=UPI000E0D1109|nr:grasp-with-spasm system ATP-grasp peptide maturase [Kordia sp. SMS9]AXG71508.1 ATP-GRASP peptide maturase, grasp-with-spasm system [Kordia sp. SMS9]